MFVVDCYNVMGLLLNYPQSCTFESCIPGLKIDRVASVTDDVEPNEVTKDEPLRWFGSMVAPQLREAQRDFKAALQLLLHAANNKFQLVKALDEVNPAPVTETTPNH